MNAFAAKVMWIGGVQFVGGLALLSSGLPESAWRGLVCSVLGTILMCIGRRNLFVEE
jgi:hypothetical protein